MIIETWVCFVSLTVMQKKKQPKLQLLCFLRYIYFIPFFCFIQPFLQILSSLLEEHQLEENSDVILRKLFLQADQQLIQFETEGTTATAALFWKSKETRYLQCANVGDSTAFLWYVHYMIYSPSQNLFPSP